VRIYIREMEVKLNILLRVYDNTKEQPIEINWKFKILTWGIYVIGVYNM
jgi:hypothetical protein